VWGGSENCEHEWEGSEHYEHREERVVSGKSRTTERFWGSPTRKFNTDIQHHWSNVFCTKCGAWRGQLGLEPTPELYVEHLMMIFREVKRVLRRDGSFYLNIGDTYSASPAGNKEVYRWQHANKPEKDLDAQRVRFNKTLIAPAKCMICIPERVMFAMIEEGWILRNKNIWHKNNAMPSSVKDRFSTTWEYLYFFTKNDSTILWRNQETGEWRDTRPTKQENYPWGGMYQNIETREFRWDKPPQSEKDNWIKYQPLWMGFDYYFELDAVREPHKTQSLERYQRQVNFSASGRTSDNKYIGQEVYPGSSQIYRGGRNLAPDWFDEMFPPDEEYKGKFDDLFGHGPNPQSFNLRVSDVKRGKHGAYVEGDKVKELKASEEEIEEYEYPERAKKDKQYQRRDTQYQITPTEAPNRSSKDWKAEAAKRGQLFDQPVAHQGGGNTGLKGHHGSSHDGRGGFDGEARDRPLVAPHHPYRGDGWEKQAIEGREPKIKHDQAVGRTGNVAYTDPLHTRDYSPKGKNPGDILSERQENIVGHFEQKGSGGHYLYGGIESPEGRHEHPLGKNPGDYWEITTQPFKGAHFAVFPEKLCVRPILASTRVGDVVLDPFAGSGTAAVVAKRLGRKAILIDCVEQYCAIAKNRVSKVEYQPGLKLE